MLCDYVGQPLYWWNMGFACYKLQGHEETLITATWEGKLVVAEAEGTSWLLKGTSPLSENIKIYPIEARNSLKTATPLASFEFRYEEMQQEFCFADGRSFIWTWERSATPTLTCTLPDGQNILHLQVLPQRLFELQEFRMEIDPQSANLAETPLLAFMSLYIGRLVRSYSEDDLEYNGSAWIKRLLTLFERI